MVRIPRRRFLHRPDDDRKNADIQRGQAAENNKKVYCGLGKK